MAFNNIPPNGFPALPDVEDLEAVEKDVTTLKSSVLGLTEDVTDLNTQKANQITIAPFFNSETSYDVGDLVYYNGLTYRCINAHEGEWDADDFSGTTIANELDELKSGLTSATTVANITSTFYTHLESGVTLHNNSFVVKCGKHIVGDVILTLNSGISGDLTSLLTLAYAPIASINSYCVGAINAYGASGVMYMFISSDSAVVQVQNTYSLNNIQAIKIHLDYFSNT